MTSPDDPEDGDPKNSDPKDGGANNGAGKEDKLNLAYIAPHTRAYYANPDERIQNALSHVNPESAVTFLRKTHGPQAGQEALIRAFLAERQHHREAARYWLGVYEELVE